MKKLIIILPLIFLTSCAALIPLLPLAEKAGETVVEDVAVEELEKYEEKK